MFKDWHTRIEPVEPTRILLTPRGRAKAERIQSGLLRCGCYVDACHCGQYPTAAEAFTIDCPQPREQAEALSCDERSDC